MLLLLQTFQATGIIWKVLETALLRVNGYARRHDSLIVRDVVCGVPESRDNFSSIKICTTIAFLLLFEVRET